MLHFKDLELHYLKILIHRYIKKYITYFLITLNIKTFLPGDKRICLSPGETGDNSEIKFVPSYVGLIVPKIINLPLVATQGFKKSLVERDKSIVNTYDFRLVGT